MGVLIHQGDCVLNWIPAGSSIHSIIEPCHAWKLIILSFQVLNCRKTFYKKVQSCMFLHVNMFFKEANRVYALIITYVLLSITRAGQTISINSENTRNWRCFIEQNTAYYFPIDKNSLSWTAEIINSKHQWLSMKSIVVIFHVISWALWFGLNCFHFFPIQSKDNSAYTFCAAF